MNVTEKCPWQKPSLDPAAICTKNRQYKITRFDMGVRFRAEGV